MTTDGLMIADREFNPLAAARLPTNIYLESNTHRNDTGAAGCYVFVTNALDYNFLVLNTG